MNRLTPIRETIETIRGYPSKLVVYKTAASRFYWTRVYLHGRYLIKTTKCESVTDAKKFAVAFYEDCLINAKSTNFTSKNKSFAVIGRAFMDAAQKTANPKVHRVDEARFNKDLLPFFGEQEISTITNAQISQFIDRLNQRNLSKATINHFLVVLRKILKFAIANDVIDKLPHFPKITGRLATAQKRDYLTSQEYRKLCKTANLLASEQRVVRGVEITIEMKLLIQFMVNSFIRPSDLRVLKHQHVQVRTDRDERWLALNHPATKTTATEVQAMPSCVGVYQKIVELRKQTRRHATREDYVFFPEYKNRDTAMAVVGRLFREIVAVSCIKTDTAKNITLYSLRHTAIMMRLVNGNVNTLALARNARTSQAMIDKFYASHLTTDQVRRQLHAFPHKESNIKKKKIPQ